MSLVIKSKKTIKGTLDHFYEAYNQVGFIDNDPVQIPHLFSKQQDIEIMGFFAAVLAWGQRITIINNCKKLIEIMDGEPHDFILNHSDSDLKRCEKFVHRTFNDTDLLSMIAFLKIIYNQYNTMEPAFANHLGAKDKTVENALNGFRNLYENSEAFIKRTTKHIAHPAAGSACKRINMFLRWMVRSDNKGVDFGLWKKIKPSQLICPLDLHVIRVATEIGLLSKPKSDWKTAVLLTNKLKTFDAIDPVKYDFALFGMGVNKADF
ncbi:MAG: TIGR02757 family protein [bacterium]|nr:TIGR02757 family protein [bacterium]